MYRSECTKPKGYIDLDLIKIYFITIASLNVHYENPPGSVALSALIFDISCSRLETTAKSPKKLMLLVFFLHRL